MIKSLKELIGTAIIVLMGCGIASTSNTILGTSVNLPGAFTLLTIAIGFATSYLIASYIFNKDKCTFNPILTFSDILLKNKKIKQGLIEIIGQVLGGFIGAEILGIILGQYGSLGANGYGLNSIIGANLAQSITIEIIISLILTIVYLKKDKNKERYIALTIILIYLFAIPYTNASANPARSIGPAILMGIEYLKQLWVFILCPFIGAIIAIIIYKISQKNS